MKCPICGKELELKNKQIGTNENGDPIFNKYAICRDCRKQWNLDKQRAKKEAAKQSAPDKTTAQKESPSKKAEVPKKAPVQKAAVQKAAAPKTEAVKKAPAQKAAAQTAEVAKKAPAQTAEATKKAPAQEAASKKASAQEKNGTSRKAAVQKSASQKGTPTKSDAPRPKRRSSDEEAAAAPAKKPVKKRTAKSVSSNTAEEKRYSNIPPERVRVKHETTARQGYEDMLATGAIGKPVRKKKTQADEDTRAIKKASVSSAEARRKNTDANYSTKKPEPEIDEYDDDDYYEDAPRFRVMRIVLAVISLAGFGYLMYRGFSTGLSSGGEGTVSGLTFVIVALCLLVSALLYFITLRTNSVFAFLLPMLFYLGGGVFAFLKKGDEFQLLIAAGVCAVLAVITLILAITSRNGDDYEDDYDDAFEDDYADDDYDE